MTPAARYFSSFNPCPPITAGESLRRTAESGRPKTVSIRARQLRRANPAELRAQQNHPAVSIRARQLRRANRMRYAGCTGLNPFQSAPANYGGRIDPVRQRLAVFGDVSIRARQLRRANLLPSRGPPDAEQSFNPRPPITAGESRAIRPLGGGMSSFNPRPPITAGESKKSGGFAW